VLLFACVRGRGRRFVLAQGGGSSHSAALGPTGHRAGTTTVVSTTTTTPTTTTTVRRRQQPRRGRVIAADLRVADDDEPVFAANMAALWSGVSSGVAQNAVPGFFPEPAYLQLKDISGAASDYTERLIAEYEEDVASAINFSVPMRRLRSWWEWMSTRPMPTGSRPGRATTASGTSKCRTPGCCTWSTGRNAPLGSRR